MEQEDLKTRLENEHTTLVQCLDVQHPLFRVKLDTGDLETRTNLDRLLSGNRQLYDQRREFLQWLGRWSEDFYQRFLKCLVETNQGFLLVTLKEDLQQHDSEIGDLSDENQAQLPVWDRRNLKEQCPVIHDTESKTRLKKCVDMLKELDMLKLSPALLRLYVVDKETLDRMQLNTTMVSQIIELIKYIEQGPRWRLHAFLKSLVETGQTTIIKALDIKPETYLDVSPAEGVSYTIKEGDMVRIAGLTATDLEQLQDGHGGWNPNMAEYIGRVGRVTEINKTGDCVVLYGQRRWLLNPAALCKTEGIWNGDKVKILEDKEIVTQMQLGHGEWHDQMTKILGKTGTVMEVYTSGDLRVFVEGDALTLNPDICQLISSEDRSDKNKLEALEMLQAFERKRGAVKIGKENLVAAAHQGHLHVVREILEKFPESVHSRDQGKTPLAVASHQGHADVVRLLLEAGAEFDAQDDDGDTAIACAVIGGYADIVRLLTERGADVNKLNNKGIDALHIAVNKEHAGCVRILLENQINVNTQDPYGDTPLHDAIVHENEEIVSMLVNHPGLDFTILNQRGFNVLHHAVLKGNIHATREILACNAELIDVQKEDGFTALHLAVLNEHQEIAEMLLDMGNAHPEIKNNKGQTALAISVFKGNLEMTRLLLRHGADVNASDQDGDTCLHQAIMRVRISGLGHSTSESQGSDLELATLIREHGADLECKNSRGQTPLDLTDDENFKKSILAVKKTANVEVRERPLPKSPDPPKPSTVTQASKAAMFKGLSRTKLRQGLEGAMEHLNFPGNESSRAGISCMFQLLGKEVVSEVSPDKLAQAAILGQVEAVQKILAKFPDKVDEPLMGRTALQLASSMGHGIIIDMLLKAGASKELADEEGHTALFFAIDGNQPEAVDLLLRRGANPNLLDNKGVPALGRAAFFGHCQCVRNLLRCESIIVSLQDMDGDSPLHLAVVNNRNDVVDLLLEHPGVDAGMENEMGFNALQLAAKIDNQYAARQIIRYAPHLVDVKAEGHAPLHIAAINNHVVIATNLLEEGHANVNTQNYRFHTPLALAIFEGYLDIVDVLVKHGADVNLTDDDGDTALHHALTRVNLIKHGLKQGHQETADAVAFILCQNGANLEFTNRKRQTPLSLISDDSLRDGLKEAAIEAQKSSEASGHTIQQSMNTSSSGQSKTHQSGTPAHSLAKDWKSHEGGPGETGKNAKTVDGGDDLKKTPIPCTRSEEDGGSDVLHDAVANNNNELLELLLTDSQIESILHQPISDGLNLFHLCIIYRNQQGAHMLLDKSPNLASSHNSTGQTALHLAADLGYLDMVKYLIEEENFPCDTRNAHSQTPLFMAAGLDDRDIAEYLLDSGASINTTDCNGNTCLHCIISSQSVTQRDEGKLLAMVEFLSSRGANLMVQNNDGKTVLNLEGHGALRRGLLPMVRPCSLEQHDVGPEILITQTEDAIIPLSVSECHAADSGTEREMNTATIETVVPSGTAAEVGPSCEQVQIEICSVTTVSGLYQPAMAATLSEEEISGEGASQAPVWSENFESEAALTLSAISNREEVLQPDSNPKSQTLEEDPGVAQADSSNDEGVRTLEPCKDSDSKEGTSEGEESVEEVNLDEPELPSCEGYGLDMPGQTLPKTTSEGLETQPCTVSQSLAEHPDHTDAPQSEGFVEEASVTSLQEERLCRICLEEEADITFQPCGHQVVCSLCFATTSRMKKCLRCRVLIERPGGNTLSSFYRQALSMQHQFASFVNEMKLQMPPNEDSSC